MTKICEFKQESFVLKTNEINALKYDDPTYCVLYKTKSHFILVKHIDTTIVETYDKYKKAIKEFNKFVATILDNE